MSIQDIGEWNRGYSDGFHGMPQDSFNKNYIAGWECGEANASADFDPMTDEERKEVYGHESRSQKES